MGNAASVGSASNNYTPAQNTNTDTAVNTENNTGNGVASSGNGVTPDVKFVINLTIALASFSPKGMSGDFEAKLAEITSKLKDVSVENEEDRVNNEQENKRKSIQENQSKIEDSDKKVQDSEAKQKKSKIANIFAAIGQALGAAIMAVAGAALILTGAGAAAGVALLVASVVVGLAATDAIMSATREDGLGMGGAIAKASGADEDQIKKWNTGVSIALAASSAVASMAAMVVTGGVSGAATVQAIMNVANAATGLMAATSTAVSAGFGHAASKDNEEAMDLQADSQEIQAFMQQLDDLIDQAMTLLMSSNERFNAMMDSLSEMAHDTGNTLSNNKFAG